MIAAAGSGEVERLLERARPYICLIRSVRVGRISGRPPNRLENLPTRQRSLGDQDDPSVPKADVAHPIEAGFRVDDPSATDHQVEWRRGFSRARGADAEKLHGEEQKQSRHKCDVNLAVSGHLSRLAPARVAGQSYQPGRIDRGVN
jgi:hypothetical protein